MRTRKNLVIFTLIFAMALMFSFQACDDSSDDEGGELTVTVNFTGTSPSVNDELSIVVFYSQTSIEDAFNDDGDPDVYVDDTLDASDISNGVTRTLTVGQNSVYVGAFVNEDGGASDGPDPGELLEFYKNKDTTNYDEATLVPAGSSITINLDSTVPPS